MKILGIETSCDETGSAVIEANLGSKKVKILSNVVASSLTLHSKTGGIIPEIAAREQVKYIIPVIQQAMKEANIRHSGNQAKPEHPESPTVLRDAGQASMTETIDAIAVTIGPGLIGSLLVGVETARTLAYVWKKPIIPVNHLIGHIYANFVSKNPKSEIRNPKLKENIAFPALALIVSGGHTDLVLMKDHGKIKWLGGTRDDAAGEALDKIGRLLGLPYPAGSTIEKLAQNGDPKSFPFPRPMIHSKDFDFSFSGLKTAVLRETKTIKQFSNLTIVNLCASIQQAIIDVLVVKTLKAAQKHKVKSILLGGGVAANQTLRNHLKFEIGNLKLEIKLFVPPKSLCTDNGAMIATAAFFNYKEVHWKKVTANPELYFNC